MKNENNKINGNKKKKKKKLKKQKKSTKKIVVQKDRNSFYQIIITSQNKLLTSVFKTFYESSALKAFNKIIEENRKVKFPIEYSSRDHKLIPSKYELLLMKTKEYPEENQSLLRNEFGKLIPNISNSEKMVIFKKEKYLFEESFWIYGLNPKSQRKDYNYILNKLILDELKNRGVIKHKFPVKTISIFKNKLIIEDDDGNFDMIMCKCMNDSTRLYTELKNDITSLNIKCVFFSGFAKGVKRERLFEKIAEKTGWNKLKINRSSTRP